MIFQNRRRRKLQQKQQKKQAPPMAMTSAVAHATATKSLDDTNESPEIIIPTIILKPELAIQTLDMFTVAATSCESTSSSSSSNDSLVPMAPGESVSKSSSCCYGHLPILEAVNVDSFSASSSQTVLYGYQDQVKSKKRSRAAFLSATVVKESKHSKLGMGLVKHTDGSLQVSSLSNDPECLLSEAPFQKGDVLISINNISCEGKSLSSVGKLLKQSTGILTVVVQNKTGDSTLVESMIRKPSSTSKTGLGVVQAAAQQIKVSSINPQGPFAESLLSRRDTILSVNGVPCECLGNATEAAKLIVSAKTTVTVVAERRSDNAAVVAMAA